MHIDKIEFIASLATTATAISISGLGDGAVVRLDIPASEIYSIVQLQLLSGKVFKVTIEEIEDKNYGKSKTKTDST